MIPELKFRKSLAPVSGTGSQRKSLYVLLLCTSKIVNTLEILKQENF